MQTRFCQSCGSDMATLSPGKNADGSDNTDYCVYCYPAGSFNNPNETIQEMIDTCAPFWVEYGIATDIADAKNKLANHLPTLKRWQV